MAARFTAANSQRLSGPFSAGASAYPFTVGMWAKSTTVAAGVGVIWQGIASGASTHYWAIRRSASSVVIVARAGGTEDDGAIPSLTANEWVFILGRFVSATNRWLHVWTAAGSVLSAQLTGSRSPAGVDTYRLGGDTASFLDGNIGEFWIATADPQPDGSQLSGNIVRRLGLDGPFAFPHLAPHVIEYKSLRQSLTSDDDLSNEEFVGPYGSNGAVWSNVNGVILGDHPPLSASYRTPFIPRDLRKMTALQIPAAAGEKFIPFPGQRRAFGPLLVR